MLAGRLFQILGAAIYSKRTRRSYSVSSRSLQDVCQKSGVVVLVQSMV